MCCAVRGLADVVLDPRRVSSSGCARFVQGKVNLAQIAYKTRGETLVEGEIAGTSTLLIPADLQEPHPGRILSLIPCCTVRTTRKAKQRKQPRAGKENDCVTVTVPRSSQYDDFIEDNKLFFLFPRNSPCTKV